MGREPEQRGELVAVKEWGRKEVSIESILECSAVCSVFCKSVGNPQASYLSEEFRVSQQQACHTPHLLSQWLGAAWRKCGGFIMQQPGLPGLRLEI